VGIHKSAVISPKAELDPTCVIGPNVVIEDNVKLGANVEIKANAYICKGTEIGDNTVVYMSTVIGGAPQDYAYKGEESYTKIGKNNIIREFVTIHRGTAPGSSTIVGDNNMLMVAVHLGHNCEIADNVIIVNSALLAGYVKVEKGAFISGNVVFHQFCRIGRHAMIGGFTGVNKDVPPYMLVRGPSAIRGLNLVGMRRLGFKPDKIREIKNAFKLLYMSDMKFDDAMKELREKFHSEEVGQIVEFIEKSKRGICKYRYSKEEYFE